MAAINPGRAMLLLVWVFLLLWPGGGDCQPTPKSGRPQIVYRGEPTKPTDLKRQGGILPRMNPPPRDSFRLSSHVSGTQFPYGKRISAYVSTTDDPLVTLWFLKDGAEPGAKESFIYHIHATPNMVDVKSSLGNGYDIPEESEFAALGGIRWDQIIGWTAVPIDLSDRALVEFAVDPLKGFVRNPDYNPKYDKYTTSGAQPSLDWKNDVASQGKTAYNYATEFMDLVGEAVGWTGSFPLFTAPDHAEHQAALRKAIEQAAEAVRQVEDIASEVDGAHREVEKTKDPMAAWTWAMKASGKWDRTESLTIRALKLTQDHFDLHSAYWINAMNSLGRIRISAAQAVSEANLKAARHYKEEAKKAAEGEVDPESTHPAKVAREEAGRIRPLKEEAQGAVKAKAEALERIAYLETHPMEKLDSHILQSSRETREKSLARESKLLRQEYLILRDEVEQLSAEATEAAAQIAKADQRITEARKEADRKQAEAAKKSLLDRVKGMQDQSSSSWLKNMLGGLAAMIGTIAPSAVLSL